MKKQERPISALVDSKLFTNFRVAVTINHTSTVAVIRKTMRLYVKDKTFQKLIDQEAE